MRKTYSIFDNFVHSILHAISDSTYIYITLYIILDSTRYTHYPTLHLVNIQIKNSININKTIPFVSLLSRPQQPANWSGTHIRSASDPKAGKSLHMKQFVWDSNCSVRTRLSVDQITRIHRGCARNELPRLSASFGSFDCELRTQIVNSAHYGVIV